MTCAPSQVSRRSFLIGVSAAVAVAVPAAAATLRTSPAWLDAALQRCGVIAGYIVHPSGRRVFCLRAYDDEMQRAHDAGLLAIYGTMRSEFRQYVLTQDDRPLHDVEGLSPRHVTGA